MTRGAGIASCSLFRAAAIRRIRGFDESIPTGQDAELFLRLSKVGRWLHIPGEPGEFYIGFTAGGGEECNLSFKYVDRKRRWVQIRERFIFRQHGDEVVPRTVYLRTLGRLWHKAGNDYHSQGRIKLAAVCYRKALTYQPRAISSWWRLTRLESAIRRAARNQSNTVASLGREVGTNRVHNGATNTPVVLKYGA